METTYTYGRRLPVYMLHYEGAYRTYSVVQDSPSEETLSDRLVRRGPSVLSMAELLTVALGTHGKKPNTLLALSSRIMKEYGEKSVLSATDAEALSRQFSISIAQAAQIVACAELGRRFYKKNEASLPIIRTAQDVASYVGDMRTLSKEHLRGLYLNSHYKIIHDEVIAIGTVDTSIIHPREVFRPALEYAATAMILVHNHPSGSTAPSDADIAITQQLIEAGKVIGIDLVDHVIVTKNSFSSVPARYTK